MNKSNAVCTKNYDPYYGFSVIQQGDRVSVCVAPNQYLVTILDNQGRIIGTASKDEFAMHFAVESKVA